MDKSDLFEFYEILALVLPGAVMIYGLSKLYPATTLFSFNNFSIGEFGVFALISYAMGHIVQVFGGLIEFVWRKLRGDPTEWLKAGKKQLIFEYQIDGLEEKIAKRLGVDRHDFHINNLTRREWLNMVKQMQIAVEINGNTARLNKFQAIYMMCRGLIATLFILTFASAFTISLNHIYIPFILLFFALILFYRMARFERHSTRELFIQFLQLPSNPKDN